MEEQVPNGPEEQVPDSPEQQVPDGLEEQGPYIPEKPIPANLEKPEESTPEKSNTTMIILVVALVAALAIIGFLLVVYVFGDGSDEEAVQPLPPPATVEATLIPPTPEPGDPTATVIARAGVNVRTGPSSAYPIIGIAPFGSTLEIVGVSQDRTWWVVNIPGAPNDDGWVSDEYVEAKNSNNVLIIPPPPPPTPVATPLPTSTPAPDIAFTASRTTINTGEMATLSWSVENVTAVYLYPVGDRFENYPKVGQGSIDVQPFITTSYELLTFNPDGSTSASRIEITVVSGLTTGRWLLKSYSTREGGYMTPLPGSEITARFGADGSLSGSAGCNSYNGSFTAFDQTLRTFTLTASQALCQEPIGIMEQEGTFLTLMQQAARMTINAGQLVVFDSNGNRILEFVNG